MAQITVYTTEPCSFCVRVKQLLAARGVEYEEVNLSKDPAGRAQLVERTGMLSFPQVVIGDELDRGLPRDATKPTARAGFESCSPPSGRYSTRGGEIAQTDAGPSSDSSVDGRRLVGLRAGSSARPSVDLR